MWLHVTIFTNFLPVSAVPSHFSNLGHIHLLPSLLCRPLQLSVAFCQETPVLQVQVRDRWHQWGIIMHAAKMSVVTMQLAMQLQSTNVLSPTPNTLLPDCYKFFLYIHTIYADHFQTLLCIYTSCSLFYWMKISSLYLVTTGSQRITCHTCTSGRRSACCSSLPSASV